MIENQPGQAGMIAADLEILGRREHGCGVARYVQQEVR